MTTSITARENARGGFFFSKFASGCKFKKRTWSLAALILLGTVVSPVAVAQVNLATVNSTYTQNFDALTSSPNTWSDNTTLPGWYYVKTNAAVTSYNYGTGSGNAGGLYSFGVAGTNAVTDRALGSLASGSATPSTFAVRLANHTGVTLAALQVKYTGEEWRTGSTGSPQKLQFQYQIVDASQLSSPTWPASGTWTPFSALDFITPNNATTNAAVDGNAAANRTSLNAVLSGLSIADGQEIWLRWTDVDDNGSDAALAIDDVSITSYSDPALFIEDATCTEGDSGNTNCAFTVNLTTAVANDVTFDIATADAGSGAAFAVAGVDYVATSASGAGHATIPAGSTSYTFNVPVIGNVTIQPNRVFNAQVSNVAGISLANATGVGTIIDDDTPTLSINNVTQNEGNSGTTPFTFTVTLSKTPGSNVTVNYATLNGTATSGAASDYIAIPATPMTFLTGTGTLTQTITVNVNGDTAVESDETFTVNLSSPTNATITNGTGTGTILNDDALVKSIMAIQGNSVNSALAGSSGTPGSLIATPDPATPTHLNIVTALKSSGFYMQDSLGDGDPTTSDGIFVFTGSAPTVAVGDAVSVRGRVQEFHGSTEITGVSGQPVSVTTVSSGNPLPAAYDLSINHPSHDPATGVCANGAIAPKTQGYQATNFACLDGMLVTVSQGLAVTPTSGSLSYSTTPVSDGVHANNAQSFYATADGTRPIRSASVPGSAGIDYPGDNSRLDIPVYNKAPEAFEIYYPGLNFDPSNFIYNAGTTFHATGIMSGFSSSTTGGAATIYEMYPVTMTTDSTPTYPVVVATSEPGKLTVGTQNGLHFFNNRNDGSADSSQYTDTCNGDGSTDQCPTLAEYNVRLQKMSKQIRLTLKAPVVQVVQELENYNTLVDLANQIHGDDPTITYVPYSIRSNDPGGINIGILVRDNVTVNSVTQFFRDTRVNDACSSGSNCLLNDRPPVLLDATYQGYHFRVLAIYDRSLGSLAANNYVGRKRMEQAVQVAGLVDALQHTGQSAVGNTQQVAGGISTDGAYTINGDANIPVVVLGDFNAYEFSDGFVDVTGLIMGTTPTSSCPSYYCPSQPMDVGTYTAPNPALVDTGASPDPNGSYSYTFNAYAQEIDHIVITARAQQDFVRISHAHGNADVTDSADASNAFGAIMLDPTTAMRTSDHDGQVVTLGFAITASAGTHGAISPAAVTFSPPTTAPQTFTLTPESGYSASAVDTCGPGGASAGTSGTNTYTIPAGVSADCSVSATFAALPTFTVTATAGSGGSVTTPGQSTDTASVISNGAATFTFVPNAGYHFDTATDTCGAGGSLNSGSGVYTTGAVTASCSINVTFAIASYTVTANAGSGGSVTTAGQSTDTASVIYNGTTSFTFIPNSHYHATASDNCGSGGSFNTGTGVYTTGLITGPCTVSATFAINSYTLTYTVDASAHGAITGTTPQTVNYGSAGAAVTAAPAAGYHFVKWSDNSTSNPRTDTNVTADISVTATFEADYVPVNPARLTDTRTGRSTVDGNDVGTGKIPAGMTKTVQITGRSGSGIPNGELLTAVALNVTPVIPTGVGYMTVWSGDGAVPSTANLNLNPGKTIPNLVISQVNASGAVSIYNGGVVDMDVVVDLQGYFPANTSYVPMLPGRLLDTRAGRSTEDGDDEGIGALPNASQFDLRIDGRLSDRLSGAIPANNVGAVILNVTAVNPSTVGYITVWSGDGAHPLAANLNLNPGYTVPDLVIAKIGDVSGGVSIYNGGLASTNLVADVQGYFPATSGYTGLTPARLVDTRPNHDTVDHQNEGGPPLAAGGQLDVLVANRGGVPPTGVGAVVLNVTAVNATNVGYLTVFPSGTTRPVAANLNLNPGMTLTNMVIAKVGADGKVSIYSGGLDPTTIVVDVQGWFPGDP